MTFLIHYLARTAVTPLHFNFLLGGGISASSLDSVRVTLAHHASKKTGREFTPDDIVVANVIPMPDAPEPKQIGGS